MNAELMPMDEPPQRAIAPQANNVATPSDLLAMAVSQGADLDKLERLMGMQERYEANEARKAFHQALAAFKENPPIIQNDRANKQYGSTYSSLANLVNNVNADLSKHGLHARWDLEQSGQVIKVTCILSHALGHSESVSLQGPPDESGAKNKLQQIKSTITYLRGATFEAVTGVATVPGNLDDDGNAAGKKQPDKAQGRAQAPADAGTKSPARLAEKREKHRLAMGAHGESVAFIKECIARDDLVAAAAEWRAIDKAGQEGLWIAPTDIADEALKARSFTTFERKVLLEKLPRPQEVEA